MKRRFKVAEAILAPKVAIGGQNAAEGPLRPRKRPSDRCSSGMFTPVELKRHLPEFPDTGLSS